VTASISSNNVYGEHLMETDGEKNHYGETCLHVSFIDSTFKKICIALFVKVIQHFYCNDF